MVTIMRISSQVIFIINKLNKFVFILIVLSLSISIFSQDSGFLITAKKSKTYFPTYLGNGHFSISSSQLGSSAAESYMIKVYDHGKDDIPRIACLPEWNEVNYFNGKNWLNDIDSSDSPEITNYTQKLDMYNCSLETNYSWNAGDRKSDLNILTFISRNNKNIAVIKFDLTTDFSDTVKLSFPIKERLEPERIPLAKLNKIGPNPPGHWPAEWYPGFVEVLEIKATSTSLGGQIKALTQSEGRDTRVSIASIVYCGKNVTKPEISSVVKNKSSEIIIKFLPQKGVKYTFYKLVSIVPGDDIKKAEEVCDKAAKKGFDKLFVEHKKEWNNIWKTDIIVDGDDSLQNIIHSMMFYLLCSVDKNTQFSIPPMGLATSGYYGHIFWDADTYMLPPLLFMHPEMAKSIVMFRYNSLQSAEENAKKNNYKGAMYPWESDEIGEESTPYFAYQNAISENHIVGDVTFAQWQYFLATKDTNWLRSFGSKIIFKTAEFWVSRVNYNEKKNRYEIGKVVSVSEGLIGVSNETYTNTIAKLNLEIAAKVSKILGTEKNPMWEKISKKMFIPYNEKEEYHPTYGTAPADIGATQLWSSVVDLLSYPLQIKMSDNAKRNNLLHAVKSLGKHGAGAMMGTNFVPIIAAELGMDSMFNAIITNTLYGYLRPPFRVLAETHTNNSVNFITGAGSFLQQVIFGYTGLRLTEKGLEKKYQSMLPKKVKRLVLKNFVVDNKKVDIIVEGNHLRIE